MSDSEPRVNGDVSGFGIFISAPARPAEVKGNRDDVVSSYVRMKVREWRDDGRELQELARSAGFAKSTPSQVLLGTGVGAKTGPKFAKAFGFKSYDDLKVAAWEWWREQGAAGQTHAMSPPSDAMEKAIDMIVSLNQGTRPQLETILAAYAHSRFRDRDYDWWLQVLLTELARDRETVRMDQKLRAEIGAKQRETRAAMAERHAAEAAARPKKRRAAS